MTIREALAYGRRALAGSPSPALDARLLLQHCLGVGHAHLLAHDAQRLTPVQAQAYRAMLARAARHVPIPYIIGEAPFYKRDFYVTPDVLIPRPETEELAAAALRWGRQGAGRPRLAVDVGAGSGCLAVTLAAEMPGSEVIAVDVSHAALRLVGRNARRHSVADRVHPLRANLLGALAGPLDLIVANLPYVSDAEWTMLDDAVKLYEPSQALRGGADGLALIRSLLAQAVRRLRPGGALFLEIGWQQGRSTRAAAEAAALTAPRGAQVDLLTDLAGHDRIVSLIMGPD